MANNESYEMTWPAENIDQQILKIPGLEQKIGDLSTLTTEQKANLVAAINELVASVATKTKNSNISASFNTTKAYSAGDYAIHDGDLYRAKEDIPAGAWDESKWTLISIGEDLAKKANRDDYCPDMTVGNAEQIVSSIGVTDTDPYNYRTSGGTSDIGNRAEEKKLVGGTIAWNQLVQNGNFADGIINWSALYGTASVSNNKLTYTRNQINGSARLQQNDFSFVKDHIVLATMDITSSKNTVVSLQNNSTGAPYIIHQTSVSANRKTRACEVSKITNNASVAYFYNNKGTTGEIGDTVIYENVMIIDLTLALGPSIADFIYAKEQAHAGDGVAWFRQYFPKDYYPYNAGTLMSVLLSRKEITKLNQWDEQVESGSINDNTGEKMPSSGSTRSKNYCKCFGGMSYYIKGTNQCDIAWYDSSYQYISKFKVVENSVRTAPGNAAFFLLAFPSQTTYNHDVCVNLHWDGSRDGEYEAYELISYPLPNVELRGIWKLDANNKLYFDGDELTPSGSDNLKRNFMAVNPLNLTWDKDVTSGRNNQFYSNAVAGMLVGADYAPILCSSYSRAARQGADSVQEFDKQIGTGSGGGLSSNRLVIHDSSCETVDDLLAKLANVEIYVKMAQPTLETAGDYTAIQTVDDFGTEEFVDTREVAIPVGHETMYQANVGGFAESMYARGNGSPEEFVIQEELEQGLSNKASIADLENGEIIPAQAEQAKGILSDRQIDDADEACPPTVFGPQGGNAEIQSGFSRFTKLLGNSYGWSQLCKNGNFANATGWLAAAGTIAVSNNKCTYTKTASGVGTVYTQISDGLIQNHTYLISATLTSAKAINSGFYVGDGTTNALPVSANEKTNVYAIKTITNTPQNSLYVYVDRSNALSENDTVTVENVMLFDLTAMGLDSITTVDEFRALFPNPYYAYDAGSMKNSKSSKVTFIGENQWDEEWEVGYYGNDGTKKNSDNTIRSKNPIRLISGAEYYIKKPATQGTLYYFFYDSNMSLVGGVNSVGSSSGGATASVPNNAVYMNFYIGSAYGTTYHNDISIRLYYDTPDRPYVPSERTEITLSNIELRSAGTGASAVRDEAYQQGGGLRKVGSYTFTGNEVWSYNSIYDCFSITTLITDAVYHSGNVVPNVSNTKGYTIVGRMSGTTPDLVLSLNSQSHSINGLYIRDTKYGQDASAFAQSMAGATINYELATPTEITTEENPGWNPEYVRVDNYGTILFENDGTEPVVVPQAYFIEYTVNLVEFLDTAYVYSGGDPSNFALKSEVGGTMYMHFYKISLTKNNRSIVVNIGPLIYKTATLFTSSTLFAELYRMSNNNAYLSCTGGYYNSSESTPFKDFSSFKMYSANEMFLYAGGQGSAQTLTATDIVNKVEGWAIAIT